MSNAPWTASVQIPRYQCHKTVYALKIRSIDKDTIIPEDEAYAPLQLMGSYFEKHKPQPGGYYVLYEDGYESYSPAKAFEEGYTLIK